MLLLYEYGSFQDEEVVLENPADVPVFVQLLPLVLFPTPSVFSGKMADRLEHRQPGMQFSFIPLIL